MLSNSQVLSGLRVFVFYNNLLTRTYTTHTFLFFSDYEVMQTTGAKNKTYGYFFLVINLVLDTIRHRTDTDD